MGFFDRLTNLGKGLIQVKKGDREARPTPPEVEDEIQAGPTTGAKQPAGTGDATAPRQAATKPLPPTPGEPKPDEPPTRVKKTL